MALYPHRSSRYSLPQWSILGHPHLPIQLPLRATSNPNAHPERTFPALNTTLPEHLRFPSQELQSSMGSEHHPHRTPLLHDQRGNDDRVRQRYRERAEMGRESKQMGKFDGRWVAQRHHWQDWAEGQHQSGRWGDEVQGGMAGARRRQLEVDEG